MQRLASDRGLPLLRFTHTGPPDERRLVFTLRRGDQERGPLEVPFYYLGLAPTPDGGRAYVPSTGSGSSRDPARDARLPADVADQLVALADGWLGDDEPLWLGFDPAAGVTAVLWERWLQPLFQRPVLRLPYLPVQPARIGQRLEVVICSSVPEAKGEFPTDELILRVVDDLAAVGVDTACHVFVDEGWYDRVTDALGEHLTAGLAKVHPPSAASPYGAASRERGIVQMQTVANPWLRWMLGELPPVAIDLALFLGHGYYSDHRGSFAFAESPQRKEDRYWSRFVGGHLHGHAQLGC